ncbi:MAG: alpha/beta hydrolase, partial [Acidimicrobiales bacterium]
ARVARAVASWARRYPLAPRWPAAQRINLTTDDGVRLGGAYLPGPVGAGATVVLVHGFANSSRTPGIHAFAHVLASHAAVIVVELRGHGRSGGTSTLGWKEPLDVAAAVAAAPAGRPVVTVGVSLGGAVALLHASTHGGVAGVVAVSAPAWWGDLGTTGANRINWALRTRAGRMVLSGLLGTRVALDCSHTPSAADAPPVSEPFVIVAHDPDDWYFGPEHAEAIHQWAKGPSELWWYPGAGHGTDLLTTAFASRLQALLDERLGAPARR